MWTTPFLRTSNNVIKSGAKGRAIVRLRPTRAIAAVSIIVRAPIHQMPLRWNEMHKPPPPSQTHEEKTHTKIRTIIISLRLFSWNVNTTIPENRNATAWPHHDQEELHVKNCSPSAMFLSVYSKNDHKGAPSSSAEPSLAVSRIFNVLILRTILAAYRQFGSDGVRRWRPLHI